MNRKKENFIVTGMSCSSCSANVEKIISELDGVFRASVNLLSESMVVEFDNDKIKDIEIIETVISEGYGALLNSQKSNEEEKSSEINKAESREVKIRLITSFVFLLPLFYISMGHMMGLPIPEFLHGTNYAFTQFLLTLPIVYVNKNFFINGFKNLIKFKPNMDSLIAIGSSAAVIYGIFVIYMIEKHPDYAMNLYFESAGTILTLITLGKFLETRAKKRTSDAVEKLAKLRVRDVIIEKDGIEIEIPIEELLEDDIFIIKAGGIIPADGIILYGNGIFDESVITGESIGAEKNVHSEVISGTICKSGYVKVQAKRVGENSTISQIIKLIGEALTSKAPVAKLADRISRVFVPIIIAISVITFITWLIIDGDFQTALTNAISVLVISCPCSLGLATPVAIMVGMGKGAENGILIKSAESLEITHKVNTVIFDKTGTLTEGRMEISEIFGQNKTELIKIAYSLEKFSEHLLADSIIKYAEENNLELYNCDEFEAFLGFGISGKINNKTYYAGNIRFANKVGVRVIDNEYTEKANICAENGKTPMFIFTNDEILGIIVVSDTVKNSSKQAVEQIKKLGIKTVMLTGDNQAAADYIAKLTGIDEVFANRLPKEKEQKIFELKKQGLFTMMVGDGINDAPSLAGADVGTALGAGTEIAIDCADIVLVNNNIDDVFNVIKLSGKVMRNIKQNLFWAFFYNCLGIPLAAGVFHNFGLNLNPMFAAAAMSLSSLFVVLNALRLKRIKFKKVVENL